MAEQRSMTFLINITGTLNAHFRIEVVFESPPQQPEQQEPIQDVEQGESEHDTNNDKSSMDEEDTNEEGIVDISDTEDDEASIIDEMFEAELFRRIQEEEQIRLHEAVWDNVHRAQHGPAWMQSRHAGTDEK